MADNYAFTPGTGSIGASDDIGGVQFPRVKNTWGPDGTANDTDVATGKPMPVQLRGSDGTDRSNLLPVAGAGGTVTISGALPAGTNAIGTVTIAGTVSVSGASVSALAGGTVTAIGGGGTVTVSGALPAGTNAIGTVTVLGSLSVGALTGGTVTAIGGGGTTTISGALPAGTNAIGTVTVLGSITVGALTGGTTTAIGGGGTVTISGALPAGTAAIGSVTIIAGTLTAVTAITNTVTIAGAAANAGGTVTVSGGTMTLSGGTVTVALGSVSIISGTVTAVTGITNTVTIAGSTSLTGVTRAAGASDASTLRVTIDTGQLGSLGQTTMTMSAPVTIASNQTWPTGMSPRAFSATFATLTRPNNTTTYTANDSISNNATAGSVTAIVSGNVSDTNDDPVTITELLITSTDTGLAGKKLRAYLYNSDPTTSTGVSGGDNAAFSNKKAGFVGAMQGFMETGFSDGSVGRLIPIYNEANYSSAGAFIVSNPVSGARTFYVQYQAIESFIPSATSTTIIGVLKGFQGRAS